MSPLPVRVSAMSSDLLKRWAVKSSASITASAFAPTNIALVKYWGKRDEELILPQTSSLSVSLPGLGTQTQVAHYSQGNRDKVTVNGRVLLQRNDFYRRLTDFLDLIRPQQDYHYQITTNVNIPIAAGLASSACGFAALVKALNKHHDWRLDEWQLSVLARRGSGSACRSLWPGFVEWHQGQQRDGMDSFATPLDDTWPSLCIGLLIVDDTAKLISSRQAMQITTKTSKLYQTWPEKVARDLVTIKQAITHRDLDLLGETAEANALAMHNTMLDSHPVINYNVVGGLFK